MWSNLAFSAFLIAASAFLSFQNLRAWRERKTESLPDDSRDFYFRQFRRRAQANLMIGIVGVAIIVGQWLADPLVVGLYWLVVLFIVGWIILLAFADALVTKVHFDGLQREQHSELRAEISRFEKTGGSETDEQQEETSERQKDV